MHDLKTIRHLNSPENADKFSQSTQEAFDSNFSDPTQGKPKTKYSMMLRTLKWVRNLLDAQMNTGPQGLPTGKFSIEDYVKVDNAIKMAQKQPHGNRVVFNKELGIYEEVTK